MQTVIRVSIQLGLIGVLFGVAYAVIFGAEHLGQFIVAVIVGFATTATLGGLIQAIPVITRRQPDLQVDETILRESLAVHGDTFKDAGGWLFFTNQYLRFKSHGVSSRKRDLTLPLNEINDFMDDNSEHNSDRTLRVRMTNGQVEKFNLESAQSWQKQISEYINGTKH